MSFKCELCGGETKKVYEDERYEFWKCEKHHLVKEGKSGNEQVKNVYAPVFMVEKPQRSHNFYYEDLNEFLLELLREGMQRHL